MTTAKARVCGARLGTEVTNDSRAWELLVDRVLPYVWEIAAARLDDAGARDVCTIIFWRLAQRLHEFTDATEILDWARRDAIDESRRACMKRAMDGAKSASCAGSGRRERSMPLHGPFDVLSRREWEVATTVAQGATNREASRQLYVSEKTVEMHLTRIYRKLGVRSRCELAMLFTRARTT